jgi:hypothetical protein
MFSGLPLCLYPLRSGPTQSKRRRSRLRSLALLVLSWFSGENPFTSGRRSTSFGSGSS